MEKTLVLIKPDGIKRGLVGEIIKAYEEKGLKITALKLFSPDRNILENHYKEHIGRNYFNDLMNYMESGDIIAIVLEGEDAILKVRKINGATDPANAEAGSIRRRFAISKTKNLVHGSDSPENAKREIEIWFPN